MEEEEDEEALLLAVTHSFTWKQPLTSLLQQNDEQTRQHLQDFRHDDGRCGEEAVTRQRADVADAEDERCVLDHEHGQTDVLQLPVGCREHTSLTATLLRPGATRARPGARGPSV